MNIRGLSVSFGLLCMGFAPAPAASGSCPDLALVQAIDASGSINSAEFLLQQAGYAAAFQSREVQEALASAGEVDVAVLLWGDETIRPQILPWQRITTAGDAAEMARIIATLPRAVTGDTGMGKAVWQALDLLDRDMSCATRRIINVSGDGAATQGSAYRSRYPIAAARARAATMGVTINGLAILSSTADLDRWYRDNLIIGSNAFVMAVRSLDAFGTAIKQKLAREIAAPALASLATTGKAGP